MGTGTTRIAAIGPGALGLVVLLLAFSDAASAAPLTGANADFNQFCTTNVAGTTWTVDLTDANDVGADDINLGRTGGAGSNDAAFGMNYKFRDIKVQVSSVGSGGGITWYYWNGAWTTLSGVTDNTNSFTVSGTNSVTWTLPSDWTASEIHATQCPGTYYWVKATTSTTFSTRPRGQQASAVEFNLKLAVQDELGTAVTGLGQSAFLVSGGTTNTIFDFREVGAGQYELALDTAGADRNFDVAVTQAGYVTTATIATGVLSTTLTDLTSTPFQLTFGQKVTVTRQVDASPVSGASVTSSSVTFIEQGTTGVYYGAVPIGSDGATITIAKDGYVTNAASSTTNRVADADPQGVVSATDVLFGQKVTATREVDGAAVSGATVTSGGTTFLEDGALGIYYGAVPIASDGGAITIVKDGYVTHTAASTTDRIANTSPQGVVTVANIQFGHKVTVTREVDGAAFTGATVTSGGTTFVEDGSIGVYYGAVPIASDGAPITIAKAAYVTNTAFSTPDRTANGDAQGTVSATGIKFAQKITVTRQIDGAAVSGATVTSSAVPFIEDGATGIYYGAVPVAGDGATINVVKDGYVTNTAFSTVNRAADSDAQGVVAATGVLVSQKVTVTREVDAGVVSGATVTSGGATFIEDGTLGVYYGAVPVGSDGAAITIAKSGYVTNTGFSTTNRAADSDAQGVVAATDVQFGSKVTVTREVDSTFVTGATVTSNAVTFTELPASSGVYYGVLPAGSDGLTITITRPGYVTNTAYATVDRASESSAQGAVSASGILFGSKVTVTREGDGGSVTGATVESNSITYAELPASSGVYYGVVSSAQDGQAITVTRGGYVTNAAFSTTDRATDAAAQGAVTVSSVKFSQKVTVTREADSGPVSGATVVSNAVTFIEAPPGSGVYYAALTTAEDNLGITITKGGYVTNSAFSTVDRTADSDAQGTVAASGVQFAQRVTITRQIDAGPVSGATVTSSAITFVEQGSTGLYYGAVPPASDGAPITIERDGYVTSTAYSTGDRTADADPQATVAASGILFSQKVTVTREVDAAALTAATVTSGGTTFIEDGSTGTYYGAVPIAGDGAAITIVRDGYVTNAAASTSNRVAHADAQGTTTAANVQFGQKVTVTRELDGTALAGATVTSGGATFIESGSTGIYFGAVSVGSDGSAITIAKAGYVTNTAFSTTDRSANGDAQGSASATGLQFGQKVTVTRQVDSAPVAAATVTSSAITFLEDGSTGVYYGAVPIASDGATISIVRDGYVTNTAFSTVNRAADTDSQGSVGATDVLFSQRVTVTREIDGGALSGATVTSGGATFIEEGALGVFYGAVPVASDGAPITIERDGYVTSTAYSTGDRTADADAQATVAASGILFSQKVTVTREVDAGAIAGATVTSGGTTFLEDGSVGTYYGAVPIASDGAAITVTKDGYVTNTGASTTNRAAHTDAQGSTTATNVLFTVRLVLATETATGGVSFEKKVGAGAFNPVTPDATSSNRAYFAQSSSQADLVFQSTKYGVSDDTGAPFTASSASQTSFSLDLVASLSSSYTSALSLVAGAQTTYTFGFTNAHDWPADGRLAVTFPGSYVFGSPTAIFTGADGTATASVAGQTVTVTRANDGTNTAGSTAITVALTQITNPPVSGSAGTFSLALQDGASTTLDTGTSAAVTITPGALTSPSTSAASLVAGAQTTYTLGFTNANPWPADGKAVIVLPSGYVIGSPTVSLTGADGTATASVAGQMVTVTRSNDGSQTAASTAITVALTQITNPPVSGASGTFSLTTRNAASVDIDSGSAPAVTITPGALSALFTGAGSLVAGAQTTYTFGFTNANPWPADGKFTVTLPAGYTIGSPAATLGGADGTATASVAGQTITVTRSNDGTSTPASTAITVALTQISNPGVSGVTGTFSTVIHDAVSADIDTGSAPAVTLTPGSLSSLSTSAGNLAAGAQTTYTFGFTNANPWPADGKFTVTLPAGYTIGSPAATLGGADGTATASVAGQTITVTRSNDGTSTPASTAITVALTQITNPTVTGVFGAFPSKILTGASIDIDTGTSPSVTITPGPLSGLSSAANELEVGLVATYTFGFTNANPWPADGKLQVTFPAGFSIGTPTATLAGADGTATTSVAGQTVTVTRAGDGTQTAASMAVTLDLTDITNPITSGLTATFALTTRTSGSVDIDAGDAPGVTIEADNLASITVTPATPTLVAGTGEAFTANGFDAFGNPVPTNATWTATCGTIDVAGSYTAPTVAPQSCDVTATEGAISGFATASITPDVLDSIAVTPSYPIVRIDDIRSFAAAGADQYGNPVTASAAWSVDCGSIDAAGLFTAPSTAQACTVTATDGTISGSTTLSVSTNVLSALATTALDAKAGATTTLTVKFKNADPWPADGKVTIEFPAGFTIGSPTAALAGAKGTANVTVAGQVVTVTRNNDSLVTPASTLISVKLTAITNPTTAGQTAVFPIDLQDGSGSSLNGGNAPGLKVKAAALTAAVKGTVTTVNATTTYTVTMTNSVPWPADAKFVLAFPDGFDVSAATHTVSGVTGNATLAVSGQTVTVTRAGDGSETPPKTAIAITLNNIRNPPLSGTTAKFLASLRTSGDLDLAMGTPAGARVTTGAAKTPKALPAVYSAGATTSYMFSAANPAAWPPDGQFVVTFPLGYSLGSPTVTLEGADGNATATVNGLTATITRAGDGTETPALTLIKITLTDVTNPPTVSASKPYVLSFRTGLGVELARGTAAGARILADSLNTLTSKASNANPTLTATYTFGFKAPRPWPADGKATFTFPGDYIVGTPVLTMKGVTGTAAASVSGNTITVTRNSDGATTPALTLLTFIFTNITNPDHGGLSGTFAVDVRAVDDSVINAGTSPAVKLTTRLLTALTTSVADGVAGRTTTYTFGATTASVWPADGRLLITFPKTYTSSSPTAVLSGADGTATVTVNGFILTVQRAGDGTATPASTPITVAIGGIINPFKAATTPTFPLTVADGSGNALDAGKTPAAVITANPLVVPRAFSSTHGPGVWKSSTSVTLKWTLPTDTTVNGYSWDLDTDPDETSDGNVLLTTLTGVAEGEHTFKIKAVNSGAIWGPVSTAQKISIDATPPEPPVVSSVTHPTGQCAPSTTATFTWGGASDVLSGLNVKKPYGYKLDAVTTAKQGTFTSVTLTGLAPGAHTLTVLSYDKAFNSASTVYAFEVC